MRFPRIYADDQGETHFAEVENDLSPIAFVPGTPVHMSLPRPATATVLTAVPTN